MKIIRDEITLKRVEVADIEMIREWRNSGDVRQYMIYRDHISADMQKNWFNQINTPENLYFLIVADQTPVGLIYGADIDWAQGSVGNAGIFIANDADRESWYATTASILLHDYVFSIGLKSVYIKVLANNPRAIAYNTLMGYKLIRKEAETYIYKLDEKSYLNFKKKIEQLKVTSRFKSTEPIQVIYDDLEMRFPPYS